MKQMKRALSLLLCLAMLAAYVPVLALAEALSLQGLCEHHPEHSGCAYSPAVSEGVCNHKHDDSCYAVTKNCSHVHDGCGTEENLCPHTCSEAEGCSFTKTLNCQHTLDSECFCTEGTVCDYVCTQCNKPSGKSTCDGTLDCTADEHGEDCEKKTADDKAAADQAAADAVQVLIDALPANVTQENLDAVGKQLSDIDAARRSLSDNAMALVDFTAYQNAIAAISALNGMPGADVPMLADIVTGTHGTNLNWEFNITTGTLTVTGNGDMARTGLNNAYPWYAYRGQTKAIVIGEGITSIADHAFATYVDETLLTSVQLPSTLKSIGYNAFYASSELQSLTLPENLETIGGYAFGQCHSLKSLMIPDSVTTIGGCAFVGCEYLASICVGRGLKNLEEDVFNNIFGLRTLTVSSANSYFMAQDNVLYTKDMKELVAYPRDKGASSFTVPASVTKIRNHAFYRPFGFSKLIFTEAAPTLDSSCFWGTTMEVHFDSTKSGWTSVVPNQYGGNITWITTNGASTVITGLVSQGKITWTLDTATGSFTMTGTGPMEFYDHLEGETPPWDAYKTQIKSLTVGSGITCVGATNFSMCTALTAVSLPDSVTSIQRSAFSGCSALQSVVLPGNLTTIGPSAFGGCSAMQSITIPGSVTSIGENAFSSAGLTSVVVPDSVTTVGHKAFAFCASLKEVTFGNKVNSLGGSIFQGCKNLTTITFTGSAPNAWDNDIVPDRSGVTAVYPTGDASWTAAKKNDISTNVTWVGAGCINGHSYSYVDNSNGLTHSKICASCGETTSEAHRFTSGMCECGAGSCGERLTWGFDSETGTLTISGSGDMTDYGKVNGSGGVADEVDTAKVPWYGIKDQIKSVAIGYGVKHIGNFAFCICSNLESIAITTSVSSIGYGMVEGCNKLKDVYYSATEDKWNTIAIGTSQTGFRNATFHYNVSDPSTHWSTEHKDATCTESGHTGKKCACGYTRIETTIPAGHTGKIAVCPICKAYGYCGDDLIWTLDDAGTLTITGTGDMYNYTDRSAAPWYSKCTQIKKVVIGTGATSIGNYAFYDCSVLEEITIPEGVTSIGDVAIKDCVSLKNITLPESLKTIGGLAFSNCKIMESISLPKGLTTIEGRAFEYCNELKQIQIPSGITAIENETFRYCVKLESVTLPRNLTSIGNYAFANCIFTEIEIPGKVTSIGDRAFSTINAKSKLSKITFMGDCPTFAPTYDAKNVFLGVTATAYYPAGNETWTADVRQGYGGELTWVARQLDAESYGVKIGGIAVTDDNLSGEYWRYDPDDNILHLSDGFNNTISTTRPSLIIEVSGTATAASIIATGTNLTLRAKANSTAQPVLDVNQRGIIVTGGNLTVENIKLMVTRSHNDTISVTAENGAGGTLTVNNAWLSASATGENSMSAIDVVNLIVNGSSCVYGSTSRQGVDAIYIGESGSFSSACHVEATANNGNGIMGYGMTFPAYAYVRNTAIVDGSTEFTKLSTADAYSSGRIQTYRSYEFIGLDHAAYVQNGDTHKFACKCASPTTIFPAEAHTWSCSLSGTDTIAAECTKCEASGSLTLVPPQDLVSDGANAREAAIEGSIPGMTPEITYEGENLVEGKPVMAGTYTAKITLENTTAEIRFTLTAEPVAAVTVGSTTTPYTSLTDAVAAASAASGSTLKLLQDVTVDKTVNITSGNFTLDLNDKTLHSEYWEVLSVTGGELRITDTGTDTSKGGITTKGSMSAAVWVNGAKVTISGIAIKASSLSSSYGVKMDAGDLTLSECTLEGYGSNFGEGVYVSAGTLTASDCTIRGNWGITFRGTTASIMDCTIEGREVGVYVGAGQLTLSDSSISAPTGVLVADENAVVNITGGTITAVGNLSNSGNASGVGINNGTVNISGCTISATKEKYGVGYGVNMSKGTANITGGSISGSGADLMIDSDGTIQLDLPADGDVSTSFPGGILVEGTTLMDVLGSGASYWVGTQEQSLTADATQITGDVTVRKHTQHSYNGFEADKTTGETHTRVCIFCGEALTENHTYTETVAEADYLKSAADCENAAVYHKSCKCGEKGTETFTYGKPLDHTFDQEVAEEKFLKSAADCENAAVYHKSCKCGEKGTETFIYGKPLDHTFDQEVAEEKFLKSAADCENAAVYHKSCKCGEKGTETFTYGKPLDHTFDQEVADEKYLKSEATHTSAAVYYKSCKCGEIGSDTFTYGEPLTGSIVRIPTADLEGSTSVWIDGIQYPVVTDGEMSYVTLPNESVTLMITYTYHVGDANDVHTQYPTGMKVWKVTKSGSSYTAKHLTELDNILQYSGSSIRITGKKGIRMITSVPKNKKDALTGAGLAGYKLVEYGTVLSWASDLAGGNPLVLGKSYAKHNYAYKRGVADPVFAYSGNLVQYTNVLVGFTNEQCKDDIAMRSYMILEDAEGQQVTLYGGIVYRSIGYIAYQNRAAFTPGSAAYKYVWDIIHSVYGKKYDAEYKG